MMQWWNYGWGMGFGWLSMVIFWIVIILGIVYLIKLIAGAPRKEETSETALDILKKRYAKGEISKDEFEQKRREIE